jgi:hypothetical protein
LIACAAQPFRFFGRRNEEESWPRKTGQDDKWIFRLTAASIAALQERL